MRPKFLQEMKLHTTTDVAEWYFDELTTNYCTRKDRNGVSLPNHRAFIVYLLSEEVASRVLVEYTSETQGAVVFECSSVDGMGSEIDKLKILKHWEENE